MNKAVEFCKKHWMEISLVVLIIALTVYIINKNRKSKGEAELKLPKLPKVPLLSRTSTPATPVQETQSLSELKSKLAECEDKMKSARISGEGVHPCATLRDMVQKAGGNTTESSFVGAFTETNGLNLIDFGAGMEGMSLLMDKQLKDKEKESNYRVTSTKQQSAPKPTICRYPDGSPCICGSDEHCTQTGA